MSEARTVKEIMDSIIADVITENPNMCDWSPWSWNYHKTEPLALQFQIVEQLIYRIQRTQNIYTATGSDLDALVKDRLPEGRLIGSPSSGYISFIKDTAAEGNIVIPAYTEVLALTGSNAPMVFKTIEAGTLLLGTLSISIPAVSLLPGTDKNVIPYAISKPNSGIPGIDRYANTAAFSGGTDMETDQALLDRYIYTVKQPGTATETLIVEHLLEVTNEADENVVAEAKVYPMGSGDIQVIVDAGNLGVNEPYISASLFANMAAGITSRGCLAARLGVPPSNWIIGQPFNEIPNGALTTFTTADPFMPNSERVWLNGIVQLSGVDYTTTPGTGTIEVLWTPIPDAALGDHLWVDYVLDVGIGNEGNLEDAAGGQLWIRPLVNVTVEDTISFSYTNVDNVTHTATCIVPAGTVKGKGLKCTLQVPGEDVLSIPNPPTYTGPFSYDVMIGYGSYPRLFLTPTKVSIAVTLTYTPTATPEAGLTALIEASISTFLDDFLIGEALQFSDLYDSARSRYIKGGTWGARFMGIDSIDSISATDGSSTISQLGDIITVELDARIDPGNVSVTITGEES